MEKVKNTCGGCYHFGPCRKMMEAVLDPQWRLEASFMASRPACEDYIDGQLVTAALEMEKTSKQPPVDRRKLLIGLECCRDAECGHCPYDSETFDNCNKVAFDALAYIEFLEQHLGVIGL